jgi:hypothetical protein
MAITSRALAFASRWFDERTVAIVFEPLIADWQRELQQSASGRRAWAIVRGLSAFSCTVAFVSPRILLISTPSPVTRRITNWIVRFTAIATAIIAVLTTYAQPELMWTRGLIVFMVPSVIAIVFPFAMAGAVDAVRRHEPLPPHVERASALKVALFAASFMVVFAGWVTPIANQEYRLRSMAIARQGAPMPGVRELTTYQLISDPGRAPAHEAFSGGADRYVRIRGELQNRASLVLLPIVLIWLRWHALALPRRRWAAPLPPIAATALSIIAFFTLFLYGFVLEHQLSAPGGTGVWLPIVAFFLWGMTAAPRRRRLARLPDLADRVRDQWRASRCP